MRHRVAARASREWPRGEKRKGSPRVAPPAAGGGKSLSCSCREQVSGPHDMPAGPPPLPPRPLGHHHHHNQHPRPPPPTQRRTRYHGRCHRYHLHERTPSPSIPAVLSERTHGLPFSSTSFLRASLPRHDCPPSLSMIPHLDRQRSNLSPFNHDREPLVASLSRRPLLPSHAPKTSYQDRYGRYLSYSLAGKH